MVRKVVLINIWKKDRIRCFGVVVSMKKRVKFETTGWN